MFSGFGAAAGAATVGGSASWLFSYNKENYGFDSGMRFGRFMLSRSFANAQVGQYREDVQGIVGNTVTKLNTWSGMTTLFMAVGAALSCAGRIGMHGPAPPGWYCALFSGCIFTSIMFNGFALWLSMHGALRAQCGMVSLLTRKVRLPIPSISQIDQARVFGSSFEKQNVRDIFRVPFCSHSSAAPDVPHAEDGAAKKGRKSANDPTKEFASTARSSVPAWVRDEAVVDKGDGFVGTGKEPVHDPQEAPEHFQQLMKAQEEWRYYDIYARISMLFGVVSYLHAVTYYAVGTAIVELRGFWVMWTLPMVFMTAQALIMRLDILQTSHHILPHAEILGHLAPFFAVTACTLEYRYYYSEASVTCAWGFALLAIFSHLVMALRMLDLAWPDDKKDDMPEEPGRQWWPGSWRVPSAFTKHLWFITPPKKLDPAVAPCLLHEMEDLARHGGGVELRQRKKGAAAAKVQEGMTSEDAGADGGVSSFASFSFKYGRHDLPWQLMRILCVTVALQWAFILCTTTAEIILGPESLLKPPGEPPWIRDTKYRHYTPSIVHFSTDAALPKKYRLFAASTAHYTSEAVGSSHDRHAADATSIHHPAAEVDSHHSTTPLPSDEEGPETDEGTDTDEDAHATEVESSADAHGTEHASSAHDGHSSGGGHHRRLAQYGAVEQLLNLVPELSELLKQAAAGAGVGPAVVVSSPPTVSTSAAFMGASTKAQRIQWPVLFQPQHLLCPPAASAHRGAVALTPRGVGAVVQISDEAVEAELFSLEGIGEFGPLAGASWTVQGLQLVTARGKLLHCEGQSHTAGRWSCRATQHAPLPLAKGAEVSAASFSDSLVALVLKSFPHMALIYRSIDGAWHPEHEVHLPPHEGRVSLSFDGDDLLVTLAGGEVHHRPALRSGLGTAAFHAPPPMKDGAAREFRSTCTTAQGKLLRLALRQGQANPWAPEIVAAP